MKKFALIAVLFLAFLCFIALEPFPAETRTDDVDDETCLECHSDVDMVGEGNVYSHVEEAIHSADMGVSCVDCHTAAADVDDIYDHGIIGPASCVNCHDDVLESLEQSAHSTRKFKDNPPTCQSCHGHAHSIKYTSQDPDSPAHERNQPATCGACHRTDLMENYAKSIHGQKLSAGDEDGPTCITCHASLRSLDGADGVETVDLDFLNDKSNYDPHKIEVADLTRNPVFKKDTLFKCANCHRPEWEIFKDSIHSVAFLEMGVMESAVCTDCHSSHEILPPANPESSVYPSKISKDCQVCHNDPKLISKLGIKSDVVTTFDGSYHGRAGSLGKLEAANCASCHNNHAIFKSDDERSSVHPTNLQQTCGECHPGASENFVQGSIHVDVEAGQGYLPRLVKDLYVWLIVIVIGGMIFHNILDFIRKMINKAKRSKMQPHVIRMTRLERILHGMLAISFLVLVYTGFALVFPDQWWVTPLNVFSDSEEFRGTVHRICGVILTIVAIHHLWFLLFHKRGIQQRKAFMPKLTDVRDVKDNILFYLGKRKERPRFGRFTYMEKAEYWALVWGTFIMCLTGFILWFKDISLAILPKWIWEISLVIHFYEAILAFLAILVWHFYFVMFNPDESPLALTFITGRYSLEELSHAHPEEFEEVMKEREEQEKSDPEDGIEAEKS